eukprot:4745664-Pleurochrysis_carterae.AAC.1
MLEATVSGADDARTIYRHWAPVGLRTRFETNDTFTCNSRRLSTAEIWSPRSPASLRRAGDLRGAHPGALGARRGVRAVGVELAV